MGKNFTIALGLLWLLIAIINFISFVISFATGQDTFQPGIWFAISVVFLRFTAHDLKEYA